MNKMKYASFSALLLFLCACSSEEAPHTEERFCLDENFKQKIEFVQPVMQDAAQGIPLTGSVESNPDKVVPFVSLVNGIVSNTYFSLGDKVTRGQVLAELRSTELSSMQAELQTLNSQIRVAENKLKSVRSMFEDGISSQRDLLEAQSELDILKAEKQKVTANLQLYSASREKGVFQIKAPASGIVTAKAIAAGTPISADGDPLFTISDLSDVWVLVNVHAGNVQHIQQGMEVDMRTLSYPGEVFKGKVSAISQVLDAEAKVLKARVVLKNTGFKLKPGMLVDVTASRQSSEQALSIPTAALVFDENQHFVVVYKNDCDLRIQKVEILSENNGTTFISEGLKGDEKIAAKNPLLIYEQVKNF